jgi:hypothetical protein
MDWRLLLVRFVPKADIKRRATGYFGRYTFTTNFAVSVATCSLSVDEGARPSPPVIEILDRGVDCARDGFCESSTISAHGAITEVNISIYARVLDLLQQIIHRTAVGKWSPSVSVL